MDWLFYGHGLLSWLDGWKLYMRLGDLWISSAGVICRKLRVVDLTFYISPSPLKINIFQVCDVHCN